MLQPEVQWIDVLHFCVTHAQQLKTQVNLIVHIGQFSHGPRTHVVFPQPSGVELCLRLPAILFPFVTGCDLSVADCSERV